MMFLNLMLLAISLNNLQSWVLAKEFFTEYRIQIPWHFLIAPFFYTFLVHYLEISKKTINLLKIVVPVFMVLVILQIFFITKTDIQLSQSELKYAYEKYTSIEEIISFFVSISVFVYAFYTLSKKEKLFSKLLSFDKFQWIYTFFKLGAISYLLWIIALIVKVKMNFSGFLFSYYPLRIATTLLIFWISYQAFIQLIILKDRRSLRTILAFEYVKGPSQIALEKNIEFEKIENYIYLNKKFTDPKLSRDILAKEININKNKLSSIVNDVTKKTFTNYINELRVDFAKHLLKDTKYQKYTITAIGLESGFNSKSTFYHIFKKQTGKTPLQFKEENS